jgi:hypothetical protein
MSKTLKKELIPEPTTSNICTWWPAAFHYGRSLVLEQYLYGSGLSKIQAL